MIQLVEVLTRTEGFFRERGIPAPRLEAELLLCRVLGMQRLQLYLAHDRPMSDAELAALRLLVARRGKREPLAWILGTKPFHALDLSVEPGILVPRPDTETVVEAFLSLVPDGEAPVYVADVGCGSGAIGLAVAAARRCVRLYAIDLDPTAVRVTKENAARLGLADRVGVLRGDLLDPVPANRPVDWVLSNPPYLPSGEIAALEPEVSRWEPRLALDGGDDGLQVFRRLVPRAVKRARRGVLFEVGIHQAPAVADLLRRSGLDAARTWDDLAGIARVVGGEKPA